MLSPMGGEIVNNNGMGHNVKDANDKFNCLQLLPGGIAL